MRVSNSPMRNKRWIFQLVSTLIQTWTLFLEKFNFRPWVAKLFNFVRIIDCENSFVLTKDSLYIMTTERQIFILYRINVTPLVKIATAALNLSGLSIHCIASPKHVEIDFCIIQHLNSTYSYFQLFTKH